MTEDTHTQNPNIVWDEQHQPRSNIFNDVYFSVENGLEESRYVFLQGNQLEQRWQKLPAGTTFTIVETGFGTGLNFLAAWQLWHSMLDQLADNCKLHFISIEKFPLSAEELKKAHCAWPELSAFSNQLVSAYPPQPWYGTQTLSFCSSPNELKPNIELSLVFEDVSEALIRISGRTDFGPHSAAEEPSLGEKTPAADAWFLDGFAPAKNPEMWTATLFNAMKNNSRINTSFATFTAAGVVRRALLEVGFNCRKVPGFGRKREMLLGQFEPNTNMSTDKTENVSRIKRVRSWPSWPYKARHQKVTSRDRSAIVVGAGLAGCHAANALARAGFKVTVLEQNTIASGASSNKQGVVYTKFSASNEPLAYFNRIAQIYADHFYENTGLYQSVGAQCGVLQLFHDEKAAKRLQQFSKNLRPNPRYGLLSREQASSVAGLDLPCGGLIATKSGWLAPQALCDKLLAHQNIQVFENCDVTRLEHQDGHWQLHASNQSFSAAFCVVANASKAAEFEQLSSLPLRSIRGQVSHVQSCDQLQKLSTVICGEGYLTPACSDGNTRIHCVGATYNLQSQDADINSADNITNMQTLQSLVSGLEMSQIQLNDIRAAKVGFRCTTPDYFPIVGPVPVIQDNLQRFNQLRKKANADVDSCGSYYPGLYCSLGFGSRGLAYTPVAANLIARLITGNYLPIAPELYQQLHPSRFIIRALIKNQVP